MARRSPTSNRPVRPSSPAARRKGTPLSPLAQKMLQDMQLAGLSERTHESYLRAVRKFAQWLQQSPDRASENDLRRYLLFIKNDQQWEGNSLRVAYSGLKFFLQVGDIDAGRMLIHVRRGKGHKDRLVPLTLRTLEMLRAHWATHRNPQWLFPREGRNHQQAPTAQEPMDSATVQDCIKKVIDGLGWSKRGVSTHTLRHCFATHLLEAGVNLRQIQKYMGHSTLQTTTLYLHLTTVGEEIAVAKLRALMTERKGADHG